ncbi:MAG TPA: ATP-binding protein [Bryobacteraceae bacterium]|jgi:heavy metal sensor kinase|nr:ATP-binding protein [Bryobacteraceae bacterium]
MARFSIAFAVPKPRVDFLRGLRFRLMLSYVLFFTLLLVVIGLVFHKTLQLQTERDAQDALDEEWFEAKGYLKIEYQRPVWVADETDPEEAFIVSRLKHIYLITDANGVALDYDDSYDSIGLDSPQEIQRILHLPQPETRTRWDKSGTPYLIKAGKILDDKGRPYFFAIGRSLAPARRTVSDFTRNYFWMLPAMIALSGLLGWVLAGRAIQPVNSVAQAAHTITGSNLSLQIPLRGAGDELDRLIESFNRMTERLNQSFEQIRRFSTDVSHELRTPLTAIRGQLEVALFTAETPEQYREAMLNALEDVEKLSNIVRALLLLSQAESGQLALQRAPLDLAAVAREVVEQFQIPAEEKNVQLSAALDARAIVSADHTQIERLLSNLLSNAIKYTPEGGWVRVRIAPAETPGWTQLVVEDNGVGIPAENLPHIFDRFYRVKNAQTDAVAGLGLGLSFVAWIVEVHGGRIDVASAEREGTRFTVLLPAEESAIESPAPAPEAVA